jgi:L-fuconolactonase
VLIIDGQVHVWEADRPDRPWPEDAKSIPHALDDPLGPQEALQKMDANGVGGAVLVPPSFEGDRNDVVGRAVASHPQRFIAMGRVSLDEPRPHSWIEEQRNRDNLTGFRVIFNRPRIQDQLRSGELDWFWRACGELGIPLMILGAEDLDRFAEVAGRFPNVQLTIDHLNLGKTSRGGVMTEDEFSNRVIAVCGLAVHENVSVKISALPCYVKVEYPFEFLKPLVYRVIEAYGSRAFWGSDFSRLPCPYGQWRDFFLTELTELSAEDKELVMGKGLARWFDLPQDFGNPP